MGFSGGGSNITKAHTHDSNIVQDGGSLAANVTQFGLSAGSVLYSDGANIQELAVGSAADTLTVNAGATAPEWAAGGGGSHTFLGSDRVTTPRTSMTVTIDPAVSGSNIGKITACWSYQAISYPATWRITVNGITGASYYNTQRLSLNAGATADADLSQAYLEGMGTGSRQCYGIINCQCETAEATAAGNDTLFTATGSWASENPGYRGGIFMCAADTGGAYSDTFNEFTEIKLELSTGNINEGGQLSVWSNDIS